MKQCVHDVRLPHDNDDGIVSIQKKGTLKSRFRRQRLTLLRSVFPPHHSSALSLSHIKPCLVKVFAYSLINRVHNLRIHTHIHPFAYTTKGKESFKFLCCFMRRMVLSAWDCKSLFIIYCRFLVSSKKWFSFLLILYVKHESFWMKNKPKSKTYWLVVWWAERRLGRGHYIYIYRNRAYIEKSILNENTLLRL